MGDGCWYAVRVGGSLPGSDWPESRPSCCESTPTFGILRPMKKEQFHQWIRSKADIQVKLVYAAMASMIVLGLIGFVIEAGLLYAIFSAAYGTVTGILIPLITFGSMGFFTWLVSPKILKDSSHKGTVDGKSVKIRIAPTMSACWTFALGSLEVERSILERILGVLLIVPRLFWTSWYLYQRVEDVKQIEVAECAKVLRLALKKAERVELNEFGNRFEGMDLPKILRQVSLIDGVVFLTKRGFGLSLANRFTEDLEQSIQQKSAAPSKSAASDEFKGA